MRSGAICVSAHRSDPVRGVALPGADPLQRFERNRRGQAQREGGHHDRGGGGTRHRRLPRHAARFFPARRALYDPDPRQHKQLVRDAFTTQAEAYANSVVIAADQARREFVDFVAPRPTDRVLDEFLRPDWCEVS